jgi:hypothetical protein
MAKQENLANIFEKNQYDLHKAARKSKAWFDQQLLLISRQGITANNLMKSDPNQLKNTVVPGSLYMFFYDAKHKDTLPYWDRFPLVFPYKKTPGGFIGLNMHYLPYQLRVVLLDRLMQFQSDNKMDATTKIRYSWDLINGVSKYKAAEPCIKQYLDGHVRSAFRKVDSKDWAAAMLLPVESFVGANKLAVWSDSKRAINS